MVDLFLVFGILLLLFVQEGQCYTSCYNYYYSTYYDCKYGCCGDYYDYDYGCCSPTAQIAGGVIGGLIFIGIIVAVIVFCCVMKKKGTSFGGVFGTNRRRNVAPVHNVAVVQHTQHQPFGQQGVQPVGQTYPGPPPQPFPGPPPQQQYPGPQGPPGYNMAPQQQYPPQPPPQYDSAYPPKY